MPLDSEESTVIQKISGFVKPLKLYTFLMQNAVDEVKRQKRFPQPAIDLVESIAGILLDVADSFKGEGLRLEPFTQEWLKLHPPLIARFAKMFYGEPDKMAQRTACEMKLMDACFETTLAATTAMR